MSEPEIPQEKEPGQMAWERFCAAWVALVPPFKRLPEWGDKTEREQAAWATVEAAIRADERERRAKVVDALPVEEDDYTRLTYWMGYSDGKDAAASAIRGQTNAPG